MAGNSGGEDGSDAGVSQQYESETTESRSEQSRASPGTAGEAVPQQGQPAGTQESITDAIQRPGPQSYIQGIAGIMAAMGVLLGFGVFLVAQFGGRSLLPGIVDEFSGMQGLDETIAASHELTMAYMANEMAIFLAFLMAPLFGALVAFKLDDTRQAKMGAAGVGVAVGSIIFVSIVVVASSIVAPSASAFVEAGAQLEGQEAAAVADDPEMQMLQGMELGSINVGNMLINSVLVGIPAGIAAASIIYFDEEFFE